MLRSIKLSIIILFWLVLLPARVFYFLVGLGYESIAIPYKWAKGDALGLEVSKEMLLEAFSAILFKVGVGHDER